MRDDFRRLAHAGLTFNAPLSEERASCPRLGAADLARPPRARSRLRLGRAAPPDSRGAPGDDRHRRRHRQGGARPWRAGGDAPRPARAGRVRRGARRDVRRRRRHRRLRRLLARVRRHRRRARLAAAERDARRPRALRRRLLGGRAVGRRRSRRSASCPGSRSSTRPRPRQASGSSATRSPTWPSGTRSKRAGGRASRCRPTRRRWRSPRERRSEYEDGYREAIGFAWLVLAPRVRGAGAAHSTGSSGSLAATTFCPSRS